MSLSWLDLNSDAHLNVFCFILNVLKNCELDVYGIHIEKVFLFYFLRTDSRPQTTVSQRGNPNSIVKDGVSQQNTQQYKLRYRYFTANMNQSSV